MPAFFDRTKRFRNWLLLGSALLVACVGAVAAPLKEHLRAILFLSAERPAVTGSYPVGRTTLNLPAAWKGEPVRVDLWYPAQSARSTFDPFIAALARPTQARAAVGAAIAKSDQPFPVILYAPSWFSRRDENSFTLANLASHGFVVAAAGDNILPPAAPPKNRAALGAALDYSSEVAFGASLQVAEQRSRLASRAMSSMADGLAKAEPWNKHISLESIGVLGFSFGGGVAVEMARRDQRVQAVVNLDGSVFGEAERLGVDRAYLAILADEGFAVAADPASVPDLAVRFDAELTRKVIDLQLRQSHRPDNWTFVIPEGTHLDLCDRLIYPPFYSLRTAPRHLDRAAVWRSINAYLVAFFDRQLRGGRQPLLADDPPLPGMRLLATSDLPSLPKHSGAH